MHYAGRGPTILVPAQVSQEVYAVLGINTSAEVLDLAAAAQVGGLCLYLCFECFGCEVGAQAQPC